MNRTPMNAGWWRRNRWGVLALIPVLAVVGWLHFDDVHDRYWDHKPREPIAPDGGGWVSFAGARMRLASLERATNLKKFSGEPFSVPGGAIAWRATIVFEAPDQDAVGGCRLLLEDDARRTYDSNPNELSGARVGVASCTADDDPAPPSYESVVYFVTPSGTRATAVRVTVGTLLPRYARLTTSG